MRQVIYNVLKNQTNGMFNSEWCNKTANEVYNSIMDDFRENHYTPIFDLLNDMDKNIIVMNSDFVEMVEGLDILYKKWGRIKISKSVRKWSKMSGEEVFFGRNNKGRYFIKL